MLLWFKALYLVSTLFLKNHRTYSVLALPQHCLVWWLLDKVRAQRHNHGGKILYKALSYTAPTWWLCSTLPVEQCLIRKSIKPRGDFMSAASDSMTCCSFGGKSSPHLFTSESRLPKIAVRMLHHSCMIKHFALLQCIVIHTCDVLSSETSDYHDVLVAYLYHPNALPS